MQKLLLRLRCRLSKTNASYSTQRCSSGFNVALGVSRHCFFFHEHARVLKYNKYVEIDQFSKVDIQQINVSTVDDLNNVLLIYFHRNSRGKFSSFYTCIYS